MNVEESLPSAHSHPSPPSDASPPASSSGTAAAAMEPSRPRRPSPAAAKEMMNIKDSLTSPSDTFSASTTVAGKSTNSSEFSVVPLAGSDGDADFDESPLASPLQSPIPSPFQSPQIPSPFQSPPESPPALAVEGKKMDDDDVLLNPFRHHSTTSNLANSSLPAVIGETSPSGMDAKLDRVAEPPPPTRPAPLEHRLPFQRPNAMLPSRDLNSMFSGGGITFLTDRQVSYGYSTFKGKRASMEDFYETSISEVDGQMVAFFGVFDGHGGSRTAEYLKNNLFKNLSSHPDFIKDTKSAIVESFKQTDADYLNEEKGQQRDAGSTASTAVLLGDRLLVANVGDSRVVACRAGTAIPLSIDHKPDRSDERQRIEEAGGFIIWAGTWRVGGVLAVSRAFGDKLLKPFVVAEPEIQEQEIDGVDFIIIASDGLWNVLSSKDAVAIIKDIADTEAASRKLIEEAYAKGSSDNITCIVVRFENP